VIADLRGRDAIPEELWEQGREVRRLVAAEMGLTSVDPRIGTLPALQTLDLAHNAIAEVPEEIGALAATLELLYLGENVLDAAPEGVRALGGLKYLGWTPTASPSCRAGSAS
jgi:Leucine-rich repeat (LRR) protein